MSEESKGTPACKVLDDLVDDVQYAVDILRIGKAALLDSNIGKSFHGKPPRAVIMHAVSRALTSPEVDSFDSDKFRRGVIALCLFFLEDEDVNLALKIKNELNDTGNE